MDKLQPLIKHRYWICFGLATIFVVTAWFLASGQLAAEIDARITSVNGSFDAAAQGNGLPNETWVNAAKQRNETDNSSYKNAANALRERQITARQWPELIRDEMKGIAYQEQIQSQLTREKWAANYRDEIEALLDIVKPWREGQGLVVVDSNRITHRPYNSWRTKNPQSREIWDAQEDIWLLRSLLTSIATANGSAERITESAIREIYRLHLRGGDRNAAGSSSGGGMGGMGSMGGMGGEMSSMSGSMDLPGGMGLAGGGMGGPVPANHPGTSFEGSAGTDILAEEFGAVASAAGMGGLGGMGSMGGMGSEAPSSMMSMGSSMGSGMGSGGGMTGSPDAAAVEEDRYVDEVQDSYKTRAFLLDVLVRDDRVPDLLAALTDSDFPVEIVRVQIEAQPQGAAGGLSGMGGESGLSGSGGLSGPGGVSGMAGMGSMPNLSGYPEGGAGGSLGLSGGGSDGYTPPGISGMPGGSGLMGSSGSEFGDGAASGMPGGMGFGTANQKDAETLRIAMTDESLVMVRIGGLMTLYQSAEEARSAEATEAAAATEENNSTPSTDPAATTPTDPAANSTNLPTSDPAAPGQNPPADPAAPPAPTDPSAPPAPDPSAPPAQGAPGQPTDPTSAESTPATPTADGSSPPNPADPSANPPAGSPGQ